MKKKNEYSRLHFEGSTFIELFGISGFRREVAENLVLLGHYAASGDNSLQKFREPGIENFGFLTPENGTDRLSRNVGKKLPLLTA